MVNFEIICFHIAAHLSVLILLYAIPSILQYVLNPLAYVAFYSLAVYWSINWGKMYIFTKRVNPSSRAVFITGCDCGFGHSLAQFLDTKGFTVFAGCLFPEGDGAIELKEICSNRLHVVPLDVTKEDSVGKALDYVKKNLKDKVLWAIVNNAGIIDGLDHVLTDIKIYKNLFEVNVFGVVRVTQAFLPLIKTFKGRVVTVTSLAGRISTPHIGPYCMSKFACSSFCESLRHELYPFDIKVITVEPEAYGTMFTSDVRMKTVTKNCWDIASPEIKAMYGNDYIDRLTSYATRVLDNTKSLKISQVIDCLYDAVSLEEPCQVYTPRKNIFSRIVTYSAEIMPRPLFDFSLRVLCQISGLPGPRPL